MADRQRVEILKVLYRGARTLILDEPTAVLVPQEVDELFDTVREMRANDFTFLFISHKLDEVRSIADSITVIRRGRSVGTADPRTVSSRQLAEMMVGSELPSPETRESTVTDRVVLEVSGLELAGEGGGRPLLAGVDLVVRAGEVRGIAGVEGNGQTELVETIMGMRQESGGRVVLNGTDITRSHTLACREPASATCPRTAPARAAARPDVWANRILGYQSRPPFSPAGCSGCRPGGGPPRHRAHRRGVRRAHAGHRGARGRALRRQPSRSWWSAASCPGDPALLIAAHPTRGVDVGAQAGIWEELRRDRARGLAVL